ncbi:acetyl-CoA carboxylase biotin carboxyl carrier protein [Saccharomonospora sp.]|uniref:acetyl-CoA carboxylase biotin carboxyl carrier protein n=1 Tax=Saccharomonospora sp. TaxID=33913 RepID=UPI00262F8E55|nr:acetyl-CoA carboxylase biotin carboxyl carrier protein [Saccharomonospora sp.]
MTHSDSILLRQSSATASDAEPAVPDDTALNKLCDGLAEVLRVAPRSPQRISVRLGTASIDVEWPTDLVADAERGTADTDEKMDDAGDTTPSGHTVTAPLVGTFYQAPELGAKPFVQVGDRVSVGQQVAIVEAMKLMNRVEADVAGTVVDILVSDGQPVEYDQPLLLIAPEEGT